MNTDQEIAAAILKAMRAAHHVTCNHRSEGLGGPGCICEVVNKHEHKALVDKLSSALSLVNAQAEDEGLWFQAQTAPEAYLQQELRKLHAAIEGSAVERQPTEYEKQQGYEKNRHWHEGNESE